MGPPPKKKTAVVVEAAAVERSSSVEAGGAVKAVVTVVVDATRTATATMNVKSRVNVFIMNQKSDCCCRVLLVAVA